MNLPASVRSLADKVFHRSRLESDIEEELRTHIQHRAADLEREGLDPAAAERRARIEFGGHERVKEECREASGGLFIETFIQDGKFALRILRKSPGFAVAAVATLALAICANAVVFGVMDGLFLRGLSVPHTDTLWGTMYGDNAGWQSYPNYVDLRDHNHSFEALAAFKFAFVGLDTGSAPSVSNGFATSGNYFDVLQVQPYLGRVFHSSDEHGPNSAPYVVLSYACWHSRFQDDKAVLGRVIRLNKHPFTVVGVTPPGFVGTLLFISPDFFMPIMNQQQVDGEDLLNVRGNDRGVFEILGHLKPGVTSTQAVADMNAVAASIEKIHPKQFGDTKSSLAHEGLTSFGGPIRAFVAGLMLLSGLILLAACANLGSLFAAHASDRSREVALRLALGSTRTRILRQLLTEAVLISIVGGAVGLWGSVMVLGWLSTWQPFSAAATRVPVHAGPALYLIALGLALFSGLLFGIVPVRQVLRANPYEIVKSGSAVRLGSRFSVRDLLLVVQIAMCAVLVTSSLVAVRGLMRSLHDDFGFQPANTMLVSTDLAMASYHLDQVPAMQRRMIDALAAIPGVEQAAMVNNYPPLVNLAGHRATIFKTETADLRESNAAAMPYSYGISPVYFTAAGTSLLAGRSFSWNDDKTTPSVAIVNREFARKLFGSVTGALGKLFKLQDGTRVEVVGVVENGKYQSVTESQQPAIFTPFLQSPVSQAFLLVRSHRDPQQLAAAMRTSLHALDAGLPVDTRTWASLLDVVLLPSRVASVALGILGLMGAMLSLTGIFGMAAHSVSRRLRELGIRVALGAQSTEVLRAALGRPFQLLALGSAAGLLLGLLASRVLASIVYSATPRDPLVLAGVVFAMLLLGLLATLLPARRALSVDPLILLRDV